MEKPRFRASAPPDTSGEPEGWSELQEQARNELDPRKLEEIIAEMNRLLSECEKRAAAGEMPNPASHRGKGKQIQIQ